MKFLAAFITFCVTIIAVVYIIHLTPQASSAIQTDAIEASKVGVVSVSASHVENFTPTSVEISIRYSTRNKNKSDLVELSKKTVAELIDFSASLNIPKDSIVAQQFSLEKVWIWNKGKRISDGFEISQYITINLADQQKVSKFVEGMATITDVEISNISPVLANEKEKKNEVYKQAVEEATEKAESIAKASNKKLGKVLFISDGSQDSRDIGFNDYAPTASFSTGTLFHKAKGAVLPEQQIQIGASVIMKFEMK